jgi:LemA protein
MVWIVLIGLLVAVGLWFAASYNGLVRLRNMVRNAWSQIDVQLKRRHDLIPNLVETVKGFMAHEKETLEAVTQARYAAMQANGPRAQGEAETALTGALNRLMVVVENYPELKANQNFAALQEELVSTENKVSFARQFYNDTAMKFNTRVQSFPTNAVAGMFGFSQAEYFEVESKEEREAPQVRFGEAGGPS